MNISKSLVEYGIDGRIAIVTGAGSGVGRETAIQLSKVGAKVALVGRRMEKIINVEKEIKEFSDDVLAFECDVASEEGVNEVVDKVIKTYGRIDILVNNAGVDAESGPGQIGADVTMTLPLETYYRIINTNLIGHFILMRACIPHMAKQKYGRVINISSITAYNGGQGSAPYVASKAGSIAQTKAFARIGGPDNILVNCIAPGLVDTPMHAKVPRERIAFLGSKIPIGRVAEAVDIARVVLFLAQENLFMTGETLVPDGGNTMIR